MGICGSQTQAPAGTRRQRRRQTGVKEVQPRGQGAHQERKKGGVRKLDKKNTTSGGKGTGLKATTIPNKPRNTGNRVKMGKWKLPKINQKPRPRPGT